MVEVDEQLMEVAKLATVPEYKKCVCLVFDEVKIREDLVYDKNSFRIVGFVDIGDHNNHMLELERVQRREQHKPIASNMLVFMVRGLFSHLEFPYVQFPCTSLSSDTIFPLV